MTTDASPDASTTRRPWTALLTLVALPPALMVVAWFAAGAFVPLGLGVAVIGFVATIMLWFRWRMGALFSLPAIVVVLTLLALTPFLRLSWQNLDDLDQHARTLTPTALAAASDDLDEDAWLRLTDATQQRERTLEVTLHTSTCELTPIVDADSAPDEPVAVWALCCDDPRCERTLDAGVKRTAPPPPEMLERIERRLERTPGLQSTPDPVYLELEADRGARTIVALAGSLLPAGLLAWLALVILAWWMTGARRVRND